jgi:hypothetical protein
MPLVVSLEKQLLANASSFIYTKLEKYFHMLVLDLR